MKVIRSEKCVLFLLSIALSEAAITVDAVLKSPETTSSLGNKSTSSQHTTNEYQVNKRMQNADQERNRRSFLGILKTTSGDPVYIHEHDHSDDFQQSDLGLDLYPVYNLDLVQRDLNPYKTFPSDRDTLNKGQQPQLISADRRLSDDNINNIDLTMPLTRNSDFKKPVSAQAKLEADRIMEDFLKFLELRASGSLEACLRA